MDIDVTNRLQMQFNHERQNSQIYSCVSNCFKNQALDGFASYFMKQSEQELGHAQMVADFLISKRVAPNYAPLDAVPLGNNPSPLEMAKLSYATEIGTTEALQRIYSVAEASDEPQVCAFLVDMLKEQIEEETWSYDLVDLLTNADKAALIMLDHEYAK